MDTSKFFIEQIRSRYHEPTTTEFENETGPISIEPHARSLNSRSFHSDLIRLFIDQRISKSEPISLNEILSEIERNILVSALSQFNGNQKMAAEYLGIKYTTLHEKVKKYNIRFQKTPVLG